MPYTREHRPTSLREDYLSKLKVRMLFASIVPLSGTYLTDVLAQHGVDPSVHCMLFVIMEYRKRTECPSMGKRLRKLRHKMLSNMSPVRLL